MGRALDMATAVRGVAAALAILAGSLLLLVPHARAFTMGSNLGRDPDVSVLSGGSAPITVFNNVISGNLRVGGELGPYFSPVDGTLVRWRIRTGDTDTGPVSLRIIRGPASPNLPVPRTGAGTSPTVTPPLGAISTYPVNLPIHRSDAIGIDCCWPDYGQFFATSPNPATDIAQLSIWGDPPLADGGPFRHPDDSDFIELAVNADIEPTTAFTISSVKQASRHRLLVSATFPNPGTVLAGDPNDRSIGVRAASRGRHRGLLFTSAYLGFGNTRVGQTAPYHEKLYVVPTKRARTLLRRRGRLSGRIKLAYTVAYGPVVEQTARFRLKQ